MLLGAYVLQEPVSYSFQTVRCRIPAATILIFITINNKVWVSV